MSISRILMPKENRNTNIELLRIISMFLVLCVHADFLSLGVPDLNDFDSNQLVVIVRAFIESLSIVCVNVFVMISGWFGVRASVKGLCSFIFQCLYFSLGLYFCSIFFLRPFSVQGLISSLLMSSYWFIPAYIALYILSPALNAFLEKFNSKQVSIALLIFFSFQTIFGMTGIAKFIEFGYSCFSFVGLYLLAGFIHKNTPPVVNVDNWKLLLIYLSSSVIITIFFLIEIRVGINLKTYSYINPFVIISSSSLLLVFTSLKIRHNRIINYLSSSIFAVYLLHLNKFCGKQLFVSINQTLYSQYEGIFAILSILIFLILVMIIAIVLDQPRKLFWNWVSNKLSRFDWFNLLYK